MHKYRMVVRFTNQHVITQIIYSTLKGDKVLTSAYSSELKRYGLTAGLKNFPAAYCTGLLLARRLLTKLKMDDKYVGSEEVDGEINVHIDGKKKFFVLEDQFDESHRPFKACLDVGLKNCTSGSKIFAALKGAVDGGLDIPHGKELLPGFEKGETKATSKFDAEQFKDKIMGSDVADYMNYLKEEDEVMYKKQFAAYVSAEYDPDELEELYAGVHAKIREDPTPAAKADKKQYKNLKYKNTAKKTLAQRKQAVKEKLAKYGGGHVGSPKYDESAENLAGLLRGQ
jgi:large subunit ribosomal protein L5e